MKNKPLDLSLKNPTFLSDTRNLAIKLHGEQKYGNLPYIVHLDEVVTLAIENDLRSTLTLLQTANLLQAAYLHDVIEDCGVSREQLEKYTNKEIADMVWAVSGFGNNRKERKEDILKKLSEYPQAINLKMLDRLANMTNAKKNNNPIFNMYLQELDDYMPLFKLGDSKLYAKFEAMQQEKELITNKKTKP